VTSLLRLADVSSSSIAMPLNSHENVKSSMETGSVGELEWQEPCSTGSGTDFGAYGDIDNFKLLMPRLKFCFQATTALLLRTNGDQDNHGAVLKAGLLFRSPNDQLDGHAVLDSSNLLQLCKLITQRIQKGQWAVPRRFIAC
jgi:hypothetical protein